MFSEIQEKVVEHLEARRQADASSPPAGTKVPGAVEPYGGQMLDPNGLISAVPIVYVEFDVADVQLGTHGGGRATGEVSLDVLCASSNLAGGQAQHGDGVALLSWALLGLTGFDATLSDGTLIGWERMSVKRLVSSQELWVAAISPDIQFH